ncbi:unnamed protein product [Rotaria sp. Silwood1]|nr:unnamed protein product [Rotaria sp. Silwood1]
MNGTVDIILTCHACCSYGSSGSGSRTSSTSCTCSGSGGRSRTSSASCTCSGSGGGSCTSSASCTCSGRGGGSCTSSTSSASCTCSASSGRSTRRSCSSDYDLETQGKYLLPTNISRANLLQKEQAGRTQSGECCRLFTRCNQRLSFVDFPQADMITSSLDNIYLQGKLLNVNNVKRFLEDALYPSSIEAIEHAVQYYMVLVH